MGASLAERNFKVHPSVAGSDETDLTRGKPFYNIAKKSRLPPHQKQNAIYPIGYPPFT